MFDDDNEDNAGYVDALTDLGFFAAMLALAVALGFGLFQIAKAFGHFGWL